jgi:hypothetical protein
MKLSISALDVGSMRRAGAAADGAYVLCFVSGAGSVFVLLANRKCSVFYERGDVGKK